MLRTAVIQIPMSWKTGEDRLRGIADLLEEAARGGAKTAILPEVSLTGYDVSHRNYTIAEPVPGPLTDWLCQVTKRLGIVVVAGMIEREGRDLYNVFAVTDSTGWRGHYRKIHISTVENCCWKPGSTPGIIDTGIGRIGLGICADMVYRAPWEFYRNGAVDLVAICAAWPDFRKLRGLPVSQRFRQLHAGYTRDLPEKISRVLGVPVLFSNYCGEGLVSRPVLGGTLECSFSGGSRIITGGRTISGGDEENPGIFYADIEPGAGKVDPHEWDGPWLPHASFLTRCQFYGGEELSRLGLMGVYRYRRWRYTRG